MKFSCTFIRLRVWANRMDSSKDRSDRSRIFGSKWFRFIYKDIYFIVWQITFQDFLDLLSIIALVPMLLLNLYRIPQYIKMMFF